MPYTSAITGGEILPDQVQAGVWKQEVLRERVTVAGNSASATLTQKIPAGSRIIWAQMKSQSAITPRLASTAAATNGQAGIALVYTAPTSLTTSSTVSNLIQLTPQTAFGAAIPSGTEVRGYAAAAATAGGFTSTGNFDNLTTSELTLYAVPYASTTGATDATQRFLVNTTAATSGYTLGGTSTTTISFDVQVFYQRFVTAP